MRTHPAFVRLLHVLALILLSGLFVLGTGCVHNNDPWYDDPPPPRHHRKPPPPPPYKVQPHKPAPPPHVAPRPEPLHKGHKVESLHKGHKPDSRYDRRDDRRDHPPRR